jgi:hypothetical protein
LLVVAFSVAGCGGGSSPNGSGNGEASKPAQQVLADAVKAADAASSYHESGRLDPEASRFDRRVVKGKGFIGSATFGGQQKVDAVAIGSRGYMRANTAFWRLWEDRATAAKLDGKWVAFPASDRTRAPRRTTVRVLSRSTRARRAGRSTSRPREPPIRWRSSTPLVAASRSTAGTSRSR